MNILESPKKAKLSILGSPKEGRDENIGISSKIAGLSILDSLKKAGVITYEFSEKGWGDHIEIPNERLR